MDRSIAAACVCHLRAWRRSGSGPQGLGGVVARRNSNHGELTGGRDLSRAFPRHCGSRMVETEHHCRNVVRLAADYRCATAIVVFGAVRPFVNELLVANVDFDCTLRRRPFTSTFYSFLQAGSSILLAWCVLCFVRRLPRCSNKLASKKQKKPHFVGFYR